MSFNSISLFQISFQKLNAYDIITPVQIQNLSYPMLQEASVLCPSLCFASTDWPFPLHLLVHGNSSIACFAAEGNIPFRVTMARLVSYVVGTFTKSSELVYRAYDEQKSSLDRVSPY